MHVYSLILCLLGAYFCGSIPFGYWFAKRAKGKEFDIRDWGSSNIGFTNVWKVLGLKIGLPVLVADVLKGLVPALVCKYLFGEQWGALAWLLAVLGHYRSIYFFWKEGVFSGGKAVATLLGGLLILQPQIAAIALLVWAVMLIASKYMSVASLFGGVAAFVASIVLHKGPFWITAMALAPVIIAITHWRNIGRLHAGIESKITENRGAGGLDPKKKVVAFALHPVKIEKDVGQMAPWLVSLLRKKVLTERDIRRIIRYFPILESDQITGIKTLDGCEITVLFIAIPLLPEQIKDPACSKILSAMLRAAAVQAQRRGAVVLTLGALLSTEGNGGEDLQKWARKRGLDIVIDNGAAFTVAATLEAMERETKKPLSECIVATIGSSGFIGGTLVRMLAKLGKAKGQLAYARDERKNEGLKNLATLLTTDDLSELGRADIVVSATSSTEPIFTAATCQFLPEGAVVIDVAVPRDFDDKALLTHPGFTLIRSGLIKLPGDPKWKIDLGFGKTMDIGKEVSLVPACLAQGTILAATGKYVYASRGAIIRPADVEFFAKAAKEMGYTVVTSPLSEPELFGVVMK